MRNLLVVCPDPSDATSWYRGVTPFSRLGSDKWDVTIQRKNQTDWCDLMKHDVIFFQRPFLPEHLQYIRVAKGLGKKIWIDYDDFLFQVPISNTTYATYSDQGIQQNMRECLELADRVTVSTMDLRDCIAQSGTNVTATVIPNAWADEVLGINKKHNANSNRIVWRGGRTHDDDMIHWEDDIVQLVKENQRYDFYFVGNPYHGTLRKIIEQKNCHWVRPMDMISYWGFLSQINARLFMVPLVDHAFNRCKSNIAWQEATYAGAATVGPAWREWSMPGIRYYSDSPGDLFESCTNALEHSDVLYEQSYDSLVAYRRLSKVNKLRIEILEGF